MKKILCICLLVMLSCKDKKKTQIKENTEVDTTIIDEKPNEEIKYVQAKSGLVYRNKPKGKRLGKLKYDEKVSIIEHTKVFQDVRSMGETISGEWVGITVKGKKVYVFDGFLAEKSQGTEVWSQFIVKNTPLIDSTNFDNFKRIPPLRKSEVLELQLDKIYPDFNNRRMSYEFYPSYQLRFDHLNPDIKVVVIRVHTGDSEMRSTLIPYNNQKLIEYTDENGEQQISYTIVSYDEIAEGLSKTTSEIKDNEIITIDDVYTSEQRDTTFYLIEKTGLIKELKKQVK